MKITSLVAEHADAPRVLEGYIGESPRLWFFDVHLDRDCGVVTVSRSCEVLL
jgi:hypothetical protein